MSEKKSWIERITNEAETRGTRTVIYGGEGVGKTSTAAHLPDPIFMTTSNEDSLGILHANNEIPPTPCFPPMENWTDVLEALNELVQTEKVPGTLVLDALDGFEALAFDRVRRISFNGNGKLFLDYGRGPKMAEDPWNEFLNLLKGVSRKGTDIVILSHVKIKSPTNPGGSDFAKWIPTANECIWGLTAQWCDNIFMLSCIQNIEEDKRGKAKAKGSGIRVIRAAPSPTTVCKNRSGLEEQYILGVSAKEAAIVITGALNL